MLLIWMMDLASRASGATLRLGSKASKVSYEVIRHKENIGKHSFLLYTSSDGLQPNSDASNLIAMASIQPVKNTKTVPVMGLSLYGLALT